MPGDAVPAAGRGVTTTIVHSVPVKDSYRWRQRHRPIIAGDCPARTNAVASPRLKAIMRTGFEADAVSSVEYDIAGIVTSGRQVVSNIGSIPRGGS